MPFGTVPASVKTDSNFVVTWVPSAGIADPEAPTAAELNAATVVDLTYSLTTSGYTRTATQASEEDARLTLADVLQTPGKVTHSLELQHVTGAEDNPADAVLVEGAVGYIVERRAVDIDTDFTAGQTVSVLPVTVGYPRPDAPTANGVFTRTVTLFPRGKVASDVAVVA